MIRHFFPAGGKRIRKTEAHLFLLVDPASKSQMVRTDHDKIQQNKILVHRRKRKISSANWGLPENTSPLFDLNPIDRKRQASSALMYVAEEKTNTYLCRTKPERAWPAVLLKIGQGKQRDSWRREENEWTTVSSWSKVKKWKRVISLFELDVFHSVLATHRWRKWKLEQTNREFKQSKLLAHISVFRKDDLQDRYRLRFWENLSFLLFSRISSPSSNSISRWCRVAAFLIGRQLHPICSLLVIIPVFFLSSHYRKESSSSCWLVAFCLLSSRFQLLRSFREECPTNIGSYPSRVNRHPGNATTKFVKQRDVINYHRTICLTFRTWRLIALLEERRVFHWFFWS